MKSEKKQRFSTSTEWWTSRGAWMMILTSRMVVDTNVWFVEESTDVILKEKLALESLDIVDETRANEARAWPTAGKEEQCQQQANKQRLVPRSSRSNPV